MWVKFKDRLKSTVSWIWQQRMYWSRVLLCWLAGTAVLIGTEPDNYDFRFVLRSKQAIREPIVIIEIPERDWRRYVGTPEVNIDSRPLKETSNFKDEYFWDTEVWTQLLNGLQKAEPKVIGVTFFFTNIKLPSEELMTEVFEKDNIVWSGDIDNSGRPILPALASSFTYNVGINRTSTDDDGITRRFTSPLIQIPHFGIQVAKMAIGDEPLEPENFWQGYQLINFRGPRGTFEKIHFQDIIEGKYKTERLKGKIVLIGATGIAGFDTQSPFGKMSLSEVHANIIDNIINNRWIEKSPLWINILSLLFLVVLLMMVALFYPQGMSLAFLLLIGTSVCAASAFFFDIYSLWIPALAPVIQLLITYVVFLSFQVTINEQKNWVLEQEKKYLEEIEQLKHNFVSLFSHDLKTPIAKIQGIVDRVLTQKDRSNIESDLIALRKSSDELHKYIQNVLNVIRVESSEFRLRKEAADINELIQNVVVQTQPLAVEKNISLETDLEPMFSVEIDTLLVQEILLNLVENGIKYTNEGGNVKISSSEVDDFVKVVIKDNGIGISPEDQKTIWGKFNRGNQSHSNIKGTGLGLYLVKFFTELHGGSVSLKSELGKGTTFILSIPVQSETNEPSLPIAFTGDQLWKN